MPGQVLEAGTEIGGNSEAGLADRYGLLLENLPQGIFALDSEGAILEGNPALLSILGIASAETTRSFNMLSFPPFIEAGIADDVPSFDYVITYEDHRVAP